MSAAGESQGLVDHSGMKLGRRRVAAGRPRAALLARLLPASALAAPPAKQNWYAKVGSWPMMANDRVGDCTCAAIGHVIQQWTTYAGAPRVMSDAAVLQLYSQVGGYVPGDPSTDQGAMESDVLAHWREHGVQDGAGWHDALSGFGALHVGDRDEIRRAVWWFGNAYVGLALPLSCQRQAIWDVPHGGAHGAGEAGSWGGHAVPVVGYDPDGLVIVTWGALKRVTWAFWDAYAEEAYALLSRDFLGRLGETPAGLDFDQLTADLAAMQPEPENSPG